LLLLNFTANLSVASSHNKKEVDKLHYVSTNLAPLLQFEIPPRETFTGIPPRELL
jgi:hypothetical protein